MVASRRTSAATLGRRRQLADSPLTLPLEALSVLPLGMPERLARARARASSRTRPAKGWPAFVRARSISTASSPRRRAMRRSAVFMRVSGRPEGAVGARSRHLGAGHGQGRPVLGRRPAHVVAGPQFPARRHARAAGRGAAGDGAVAGIAGSGRCRGAAPVQRRAARSDHAAASAAHSRQRRQQREIQPEPDRLGAECRISCA